MEDDLELNDDEDEIQLTQEFNRVLPGLVEQRLKAIRSVDPNAQLTPEVFAEILDEANAMAGYDTSVKTDPDALRRQSPEAAAVQEVLRQISEGRKEGG